MIYHYASEKLIDLMIKRRLANNENRLFYIYCMERTLSQVGNLLLLFILGCVFKKIIETSVFIIFYSSLRRFSGGAHAKSHWKCIGTYIIMLSASIVLARFLFSLSAVVIIVTSILVIAIFLVFRYAPVDCVNRRFDTGGLAQLRRWSRILIIVQSCVILVTLFLFPYFATIACLASLCQSITLLPVFNTMSTS